MRLSRESMEEVYLISLDTFMLMAVMGITIGVLFVIVNPMAKPGAWEPKIEIQFELSQTAYARVTNDQSINIVNSPITKEKIHNYQTGVYQYLDGVNKIFYYSIENNEMIELKLYYTYDSSEDVFNLKLRYYPSKGANYSYNKKPSTPSDHQRNEAIMSLISGKLKTLHSEIVRKK